MAKLRLGLADLLIARPLTRAILKGEHSEVFNTTVLPHRRVAPLLNEGALDIGLISAGELEQYQFCSVRDLGVVLAAGGGGARMEFRKPVRRVQSIAIDERCPGTEACVARWGESRLSRTLVKEPWQDADLRLWSALRGRVAPEDGDVRDFASLFEREFGHEPLIYLWAYGPHTQSREAEFALKSSLRLGLASLPALSREVAAESREAFGDGVLDSVSVEQVFRRSVRYVRP